MAKKPEKYTEEEARRRFESAVDIGLHTPPIHREKPKAPKTKAPKAKK